MSYCGGDEEPGKRWRASVDAGFSATRLKFATASVAFDVDERRTSLAVSLERRVSERWTFVASAGAAPGGSLWTGSEAYVLDAGPLAAVGLSFRALDESAGRPFVLLSFSVGASVARTHARESAPADTETMVSTDGRAGVAVGKTIARRMTPYVGARVFGLPIFWAYKGETAIGTDAYHYQLGAGFSLALGRVDVHLEFDPLGERALAAGAGLSF
jgi:hypothetical protein